LDRDNHEINERREIFQPPLFVSFAVFALFMIQIPYRGLPTIMPDIHPYFQDKIDEARAHQLKSLELLPILGIPASKSEILEIPILTQIPAKLFELTWLEKLKLPYNNLTVLPEALEETAWPTKNTTSSATSHPTTG
jgi:hypothetical protein